MSLPDKSSLIQCIRIHDCHMGKHCTIFFFPIGKSKHSSEIKFLLFKICIQTISTGFLIKQKFVCTPADFFYLFLSRSFAHDCEHLSCQHHADFILFTVLNRISMIVIISVKPTHIIPGTDPFFLSDMLHQPLCLLHQIFSYLFCGNQDHASFYIMFAEAGIFVQQFLLSVRTFI